jgi:soluble lytic murein transglycosylase
MNHLVQTLVFLFLTNLLLIGCRVLFSFYDDILLNSSLSTQITAKGDPVLRQDFIDLQDQLGRSKKTLRRVLRVPKTQGQIFWRERADRQRFLRVFQDGLSLCEKGKFQAAEPTLVMAQGLLYTMEDLKTLGGVTEKSIPDSLKGIYKKLDAYSKLFQDFRVRDGKALLGRLRTLVFLLRVQSMMHRQDYYNLRYYLEIILPFLKQAEMEGFLGQTVSELLYPKPFLPLVRRFAKKYGADEHLIYSVMREESHFKHDIVSRAGAQGLMQVMPGTAKVLIRRMKLGSKVNFGPESLFDPSLNIELGSYYLKRLQLRFKGQSEMFLAAYNAGARNVDRWKSRASKATGFLQAIRFPETRAYVLKVLRTRFYYDQIYPEASPVGSLTHSSKDL